MLLVTLLLVPAVLGYQSSFNYGCQNGLCTYQLVVPKEVAQYIDQNALISEVSQISSSLLTLNNTITNFGDADTTAFTDKFNANYTTVNSAATDLNTNVQAAAQNASALVTDSATANATAHLLYDSIACFKDNTQYSNTCFSPPTTAAPATTTAIPATDSGSTGTQGSQGTVGSTVPFTGPTDAPGPSTSGAPSSDSTDASPSTSASPASDVSSSTAAAVSSTISTP